MKDFLFISGIIPEDDNISRNTINFMNNAATAFQKKFINGLYLNEYNPVIVSAPFIGPFPNGYKKIFYKAEDYDDNIKYVSFFNLWGFRNFFRYRALKKIIKKNKLYLLNNIIVYSVHTPFAKLAKWIKRKNKNAKLCLIVPDLPEYMNLRKHKTLLYKFAKYFDVKSFYNTIKYFDNFVYVSEYQNEKINLYNKPYTVIESIVTNVEQKYFAPKVSTKNIVYTGSINEKFGILSLIEAFKKVKNDCELIICGDGDAADIVKEEAKRNSKIKYLGVVKHEDVIEIQKNAYLLINPRLNNEEYTKYSFPSKTMEYLSIGRPVICYKLDGIPDEYDDFLIYPKDDKVDTLASLIDEVLLYDDSRLTEIFYKNTRFLLENKNEKTSVKKIINMFENMKGE